MCGHLLSDLCVLFFFKQKTAYEMRISDWSSDVCSSDLRVDFRCRVADLAQPSPRVGAEPRRRLGRRIIGLQAEARPGDPEAPPGSRRVERLDEITAGHIRFGKDLRDGQHLTGRHAVLVEERLPIPERKSAV